MDRNRRVVTKDLRDALRLVAPYAKHRTTLPTLGCVLIEDGWLTCSNLDSWASAPSTLEGRGLVPVSLLLRVLEREEAEEIEVSFNGSGLKIRGSGSYSVRGYDPADFITPPATSRYQVAEDCDLGAAHRVGWATTPNERGGPFTGLCFDLKAGRLLATNHHVLALAPLKPGDARFTVPKLSLTGSYDVFMQDSNVVFSSPALEVTTRTFSDDFPDITPVIPKKFTGSCTVDRDTFLGALKRVEVFTHDSQKLMKRIVLEIGEEVTILGESEEAGAARESVACETEGGTRLVYAADYLVRSVSSLASKEVRIKWGEGPSVVEGDLTYVIALQRTS